MKKTISYFLLFCGISLFFSFNVYAEENNKNYKARICAYNVWDYETQKRVPNRYSEILIFADRGVDCSVVMTSTSLDLSYEDYLKILRDPEKFYVPYKYGITKTGALTNSICLNKKNNKIHNLKSKCEKSWNELYVIGGKDNYLYLSESSKNKITIVAKKRPKKVVKKDKNVLDIKFCYGFWNKNDVFPTLDLANCWSRFSTYEAFKKYNPTKNICYNKKSHSVKSLTQCYPENEIFYVKYDGKNFILDTTKTKIVKKDPEKTNEDLAKLEEEKRKIEEEKRKIEEEKRKIAEAKKKQEEEEKKRKEANAKLYVIGSGTGFFVSAEGHVVSNDHVVGICRKVATKIEGETKYFNILKTDEVNDLGIIKGDYKSSNFLSIKSDGAEYGEDIVAFGYPLADALSTSVKLTRGIVSSLSGPGNNYSEIQIDAAIQPGNSGGPILNMEGQVVGVASSGLNKLYMLEKAEYIPENVNFAVASPTLSNFLKANGVPISNQSYDVMNTKELAKIGRPSTLQLFCMNTKAVFEELKKKKKHSDVLFEKVIELR